MDKTERFEIRLTLAEKETLFKLAELKKTTAAELLRTWIVRMGEKKLTK